MVSEKKEVRTINSLLDINRFSGESSGPNLGKILWFFAITAIPLIVYMYSLFWIIPVKWFLIPYIVYIIRIAMIVLGDEARRLEQYKKLLYDEYSSIYDLMEIRNIHQDGLIEYSNGRIAYLLVAYNGGQMDSLKRAQLIRTINSEIGSKYDFDIRGYNTLMADDLYRRYEGIKLFGDKELARDFLEIIDYNRDIAAKKTLMTITVYCVFANINDYKTLRLILEGIIRKPEATVFKSLEIADKKLVETILSEDIDTYVSYEEIQKKKYSSGQFYDSYVVAYDTSPNEKIKKEEAVDNFERDFMVKE